jgi:ketosteroid isomerase-like protein
LSSNSFLILAAVMGSQAVFVTGDAGVAQVTRLERAWNDAHLHGDATALDDLWADDFVAIVPRMAPLGKQDALAFVRSGRMKFLRYESSELTVRVYGDTAVATGRLLRSRELGHQTLLDDWRFTKVHVRRAGRWRVVAFHASEAGP